MSTKALNDYNKARIQQTTQNDARRIRTRVQAAQNSARAGVQWRWPFELMQNAHDAGPRDGNDQVEVKFALQDTRLIVSHTGKPFTAQELAALLSGGSSKEFDSEETTGRFGTGFLVTHALSTRVDVDGVLTTEEDCESFHIELIRDGDEDSIKDNIDQANKALDDASAVSEPWIADNPTASFVYYDTNLNVAEIGLDRLEQTLPYLYGTCDKLGSVCIERSGNTMYFEPGATTESEREGFAIKRTKVKVSDPENTTEFIAVRVGRKEIQSALVMVLKNCGDSQYEVLLQNREFSRLFVKFPIAGTDFLPFNVALDGRFTPEQERDGIEMNDSDKLLITKAISALPVLVQSLVELGWRNAHKLAQLAVPERTISGESNSNEKEWWRDTITDTAKEVAARPIVETEIGRLPSLHGQDGEAVSFLVPSIDIDKDTDDYIDYDTIHNLASAVSTLHVPKRDVALDWKNIAQQWADMSVPIERLGLEELANLVKEGCESVNALPLDRDPFQWLADFFILAAELGEEYNVNNIVDGLIPDQHSKLRHSSGIYIDGGISEEIKDISDSINIDLRSKFFHNTMVKALKQPGYESAYKFICDLLNEEYSEAEATDKILEKLDSILPDDRKFEVGSDLLALRSSARLAVYIGEKEDTQRLRRCPLLTADDTVVYLTGNQQILAPVSHWPESARPYAGLYTKNRILSDRYCTDEELSPVIDFLVLSGLVIPAPLFRGRRAEIRNANLLRAMLYDRKEVAKTTVKEGLFWQIAFLTTDLVQRCGENPELAKLLLDFVINVASIEDESWRTFQEVSGSRDGEQIKLSLRSAIWPFELKVHSWIPVSDSENEGFVSVRANESNLRDLFEQDWLRDNTTAVDLLHEVFGFSQLTLILYGLDDKEVEGDLVKLLRQPKLLQSTVANLGLVQSVVENPGAVELITNASSEELQQVKEQLDEKNRQSELRERNRRFGISAQEALASAIESHGLDLKLVDAGYDYEVYPGPLDGELDDTFWPFKVGRYLLEVKATTTGDVRLSPLQAETVSKNPDRFILCVIDLRSQEPRSVWDLSEIAPFAKIITDLSKDVINVFTEVEGLSAPNKSVRLRNEKMLRYGVSPDIWQKGISIDEWVQTLKA